MTLRYTVALCCLTFVFSTLFSVSSNGQVAKSNKAKLSTSQSVIGISQTKVIGGKRHSSSTPKANDNNGAMGNRLKDAGHRLYAKLMHGYRKEVLPNRPVVVKFDLLLIKVKSTVEKEGIFESVIALFMEWHERRMAWNPFKYDNITSIFFDRTQVWLPDIAMLNSADHPYEITRDDTFRVRLLSNGTMKYVPSGISRSWCHLHLLTFPFDIQTCSFEFESWSMTTALMRFDNRSEALSDQFFASAQWILCQRRVNVYEHVYNFTSSIEVFSRIRFDFVVQRKSTFYIVNLILPCATLSTIQLLTFTIPSKDAIPDRTGFGIVNVLTLVVFQTIIMDEMPKSGDAITCLSDYIMALIITSAAGIFQSVLVERMMRIAKTPPPSIILRVLEYVPQLWPAQNPKSSVQHDGKSPHQVTKISLPSSEGSRMSSTSKNTIRRRSNVSKHDSETSEWLTVILEQVLISLNESKELENDHLQVPISLVDRGSATSCPASANSSRRVSFVEVSGGKIVSVAPMMSSISDQLEYGNEGSFTDPSNRRRSTIIYKSDSVPDIVLGIKMARLRNGRAWATVANRLDVLMFLICLPLAISLPLGLFLPLVVTDFDCPLHQDIEQSESIY